MARQRPVVIAAFSVALALLASPCLFGTTLDSISKAFPDNVDVRGKLFSTVIGASRDVALAYGERQVQSAAGPVTVRSVKRTSDFVIQFLNANSLSPGDPGRGSCFIFRSNAKGNYIQLAKILLEDDPSCYLALYPSGSGTRGDVVMYGAVVKKGIYFSDMVYHILLLSFADIMDASGRSFDWSSVFKFEAQGPSSSFVAEYRAALANPSGDSDSTPASSQNVAVSGQAKVALAAAPSLPSLAPAQVDSSALPRSQRLAAMVERAISPEALAIELSTSGEGGAHELAPSASPGFIDDKGDPLARLAYQDFPRYDAGRGLPLSALRASIYMDLLANPSSVYAVLGDGARFIAVPSFDAAGRLGFAFFSQDGEQSWSQLSDGKGDLRVRVVRIGA
jgi:hypothetical protein